MNKISKRTFWLLLASFLSVFATFLLENIFFFEMGENARLILMGILTAVIANTTKEVTNKMNESKNKVLPS